MSQTDEHLDFNNKTNEEIQQLLKDYNLALTSDEALKIQNEILERPPTLAECVLWSIQGSEHCSYKSSRVHLGKFVTDGPNVILGPKEDAGIVGVATDNAGKRYGIALSHESHNHPSQIVPYEGAATGVGGNVRDVCCMGAKVIAIGDGLRFGDIKQPKSKWIHEGVVAGIAGYGNPLGIPNVCGDLYYHPGYNENCLVTVLTLGAIAEDDIIHSFAPENADGYDLILIGKPTDISGFGGASFASLELEEEEKEKNKGAVQDPNAFLERHILKSTYELVKILKEKNLIDRVGFKDLGAGGIACASVEIADAAGYGADVFLDDVHLGMENLAPTVILCSETQERFMWATPPEVTPLILDHYNKTFDFPNISEGAAACVVGKIRDDGQFKVTYKGQILVDAKAKEVTEGLVYDRPYKYTKPELTEPEVAEPTDYSQTLLDLLAHENIASRAPVFETYDKQVQGNTVLEAGQADAGVIKPFQGEEYPEEIQNTGIAVSLDQNPRYGLIDARLGAINAVVESFRNVAAVGGSPQAVTDCLCFGNPEKEGQMGAFVEGIHGVADVCKAIHLKEHPGNAVPIVAGNVSLYNESKAGSIPPSPVIGCLGRLDDASKAVDAAFKESGSSIVLIGARKDELGGSIYYDLHNELGANVPEPNLDEVQAQIYAMIDLIDAGWVRASHDISEGGAAVALSEMSFSNEIGFEVSIDSELPQSRVLFAETGGFLIEVAPEHESSVLQLLSERDLNHQRIGTTTPTQRLKINDSIDLDLSQAKDRWQNGLREKLL
ncbi:phosphoribosylformylglycinamidine synthase subunit PurL [bacterium]|jgi:phosphoribosylformylglycinamidine synthase|nr:phosphoribosylformylglycinamidine synthase subunit PurL [Opitutales bacterium]MDB2499624.1 phosphoribosylformylglycinamidine synthase subunit PurL [bacterium]